LTFLVPRPIIIIIIVISINMFHIDAVATARCLVCLYGLVAISEPVGTRWPEEF